MNTIILIFLIYSNCISLRTRDIARAQAMALAQEVLMDLEKAIEMANGEETRKSKLDSFGLSLKKLWPRMKELIDDRSREVTVISGIKSIADFLDQFDNSISETFVELINSGENDKAKIQMGKLLETLFGCLCEE